MTWRPFILSFFSLAILLASITGCKSKPKYISGWDSSQNYTKALALDWESLIPRDTSREIRIRNSKISCTSTDHYYYDPSHPELYDKKKIRVNIHFINSLDSSANFNPDKGIKFAKELIYYSNGKLRDNQKMNLPKGNNTPVYPIPYRYHLTADPTIPGDEGVYFHYVKQPYFINEGRNKNNYSKHLIKEFAVNPDSVLNIFYMVHHPDSVRSKTYRAKPAGIALGNSVKLGVNGSKKVNPWTHSGLLNHEIGHVLGLAHSWLANDGCDDTPRHPNCWNKGPAPCDDVVSNNVMDYNSIQMAFTPCQIARTYRNLTRYNGAKRALVIRDFCHKEKNDEIIIQDTVSWNRLVDARKSVRIKSGGMLLINCRVNMPKDSEIIVEKGGTLILNNAHLYNECDLAWKGIRREKMGKMLGEVMYIDTFLIENINI